MKTSPKMQQVITKLVTAFRVDLTHIDAHLRLEQPGYDPLVVERVGANLVSVAHYFEANGDLIAEPDVVFFTGYPQWVPIQITQSLVGTRTYAFLSEDGQGIAWLHRRGQYDLGCFCEQWATNLVHQQWQDAQQV